jgi:hypothetical protein
MSLTYTAIPDAFVAEVWNQVCASAPTATFFHTKVWADVLRLTFPHWLSKPIALEFSDGNAVVVPLMRRRVLGRVEFYCESMLPGVYGGPVFRKTPTDEHWSLLWEAVNKFPNILVSGNPFLKDVGSPIATRRTDSTHIIDLEQGMTRIVKGYRKGHQSDLKVAQRKGVELRLAGSTADAGSYFAIYQDTLARWGKKASGFYPESLFQNLFQLPEYGTSVKLWLAELDGTIAAGAWVFYHNQHAVYWHGAMHSKYMTSHPAHLLITGAIEAACRDGYRWFDFNPSGGLEGVAHFKRGFGATTREFSSYRKLGSLGKAFRLHRHFRQTVLRTCPL